QSMDRITLQMIDKIREDYPDYTQRHIGWLKRKLGYWHDIQHSSPQSLEGDMYGKVYCYMKK
ncbi:MAG: hypothetical protein KBT34_14980, partial [Prevotella sp.]|nr:hypothetical protein [Candidatus Prevotella equi]